MRPPVEPLFLARQTYRMRRLKDAARIMPFVAAFLFIVPTLMAEDGSTARGKIYIFLVWLGLIVATGLLARRLMADERSEAEEAAELPEPPELSTGPG